MIDYWKSFPDCLKVISSYCCVNIFTIFYHDFSCIIENLRDHLYFMIYPESNFQVSFLPCFQSKIPNLYFYPINRFVDLDQHFQTVIIQSSKINQFCLYSKLYFMNNLKLVSAIRALEDKYFSCWMPGFFLECSTSL